MKNVTNTILPVTPEITNEPTALVWNMDDVKRYLQDVTEKYANLVVTDENVADSQKALREVVSLRTGLKKFEREGKRLLNQPTYLFKSQCDELAIIIEDVEKPLRQQLDRYETQRLEMLQEKIDREIEGKARAAGLDDEDLSQFASDKRWYNKTAKWSDICIGIDREISRLTDIKKAEEEAAKMMAERLDIIRQYITLANLQYPLSTPIAEKGVVDKYLEDLNFSLGDIKDVIFNQTKERWEIEQKAQKAAEAAEAAKAEQGKPEPIPESIPEPIPEPAPESKTEPEQAASPETKETQDFDVLPAESFTVTIKLKGLKYYQVENVQDELELMYDDVSLVSIDKE